jgi:hypothetical protein
MGERTFSEEDQILFAELSGDHNSLHVNALEARRTLFGRQVVHGVHLLLWALETSLPRTCRMTKLSASFGRPVGVGETVSCNVIIRDGSAIQIALVSRGAICSSLDIEIADPVRPVSVSMGTPPRAAPRDGDHGDLPNAKGSLDLLIDLDKYRSLWGGRDSRLPPHQVAMLLASTRLVGMECPGEHSILSQIDLTFRADRTEGRRPVVAWQVAKFDPRFGRVAMTVEAGECKGTIVALLRPRPSAQKSFSEVRAQVPEGLFAGQTALVVGGSRGIGEACAKVLAAGGAEVYITYHRGATEAEAVVQDLRSGGAAATALPFDVLSPPDLASLFGDRGPSHVYYFATPPIFVASREQFSHDIFSLFYEIYVRGLLNTYAAVRATAQGELDIYYPSSIAVTDMQTNMGEYAVAKAAGETVCRHLAAKDRKLSVRIDRLPRVPTDQTASVLNVCTTDIIDVLLRTLTNKASMRLDAETGQVAGPPGDK